MLERIRVAIIYLFMYVFEYSFQSVLDFRDMEPRARCGAKFIQQRSITESEVLVHSPEWVKRVGRA